MEPHHGFHRPQSLKALPDAGLQVRLDAKPEERQSLAPFLEVDSVKRLSANLVLTKWRGQGVRVTGEIHAGVRQTCSVTLEPIDVALKMTIDRKFLPEAMLARDADPHELIIDPDGDDPPDPLPQTLDLGDLVAEELALNIDPYPRRSDLPEPTESAPPEREAEPERPNPFAILKKLT